MKWQTDIRIGDRDVSMSRPVYFVADLAANHDGELSRAKELIWLAKEAGADAAKFQHFLASEIVSARGFETLDDVETHQSKWKKSVVEVYDQYHCRRDWTDELLATCRDADIEFMTTPYDFDAIDNFAPLVPAYKIGSGDITWLEAVERIAKVRKPVLLACGASSFSEVEAAVDAILRHNGQIVLMQCNTNYTGRAENYRHVNLKVLQTFSERWPGMILGLSDHTGGCATVLGAVAYGARVVEKHFTDDTSRLGPDHAFAMSPAAWREMVDRTRELEYALGDGVKRVEANEEQTVIVQRRAIRYRRDMSAGSTIRRDDLEMLRPCPADGVAPSRVDEILGKTLAVDVTAGNHITWSDLK